MKTIEHTIRLASDQHYGCHAPPTGLGFVLRLIPDVVRRSILMGFEGRATPRGRPPQWLTRASDVRFVGISGHNLPGSHADDLRHTDPACGCGRRIGPVPSGGWQAVGVLIDPMIVISLGSRPASRVAGVADAILVRIGLCRIGNVGTVIEAAKPLVRATRRFPARAPKRDAISVEIGVVEKARRE